MVIPEYTFENVVCKMAAILSRPQYINAPKLPFGHKH